MANAPLLRVTDLRLEVPGATGPVAAVDGVSLEIAAGRVLALVGESGSGKSLTALAIARLLPDGVVRRSGQLWFEGVGALERLPERAMRAVRGAEIGFVFQEPMSALNPVMRVGEQVREAIEAHRGRPRGRAARQRAIELLAQVGIPEPELRYRAYPHELSGGMKQRVCIAIALAAGPRLLLADEPTTALDVTVQAQVLELLAALRRRSSLAMLLITHDLGVVAELADGVAVMYAGRVVEQAPVEVLFRAPLHPYTVGLFRSLPRLDGPRGRLVPIPGSVPPPGERPAGCPFRNRCAAAVARCAEQEPRLESVAQRHAVACWRPGAVTP
ncbi:MAG: ABC transporter ATP-binding protein [Planctomycetota bacterium]|nr:MAG: ABC transporter ATP-binding protein [Planctomycetota bacterium]